MIVFLCGNFISFAQQGLGKKVDLSKKEIRVQLPTESSNQLMDLFDQQLKDTRLFKQQLIGSFALLILLMLLAIKYFHNQRAKDFQQLWQLLKEENKTIQELFQGQEVILTELKSRVLTIERTLMAHQLNYDRQQSILGKIIEFLKKIVNTNQVDSLQLEIQQLSRSLESDRNRDTQWDTFTNQVEKIHPNFFTNLLQQAPSLKSRDLRLSAYIRLGMENLEIAQILGIENASVIKARHRLKKKLQLEKGLNLNQFLLNL